MSSKCKSLRRRYVGASAQKRTIVFTAEFRNAVIVLAIKEIIKA